MSQELKELLDNLKTVPCVDKKTGKIITGTRIVKECSKYNYKYHLGHNVLEGSYFHPVVITFIPQGSVINLIITISLLEKAIKKLGDGALNEEIFHIEDMIPNVNLSISAPIDITDLGNEYRYKKSVKREIKKSNLKYKKQEQLKIKHAKQHPKLYRADKIQKACTIVTNYIFAELENEKVSKINKSNLSKTGLCEWLMLYYTILRTVTKKPNLKLLLIKSMSTYLAKSVSCSRYTASCGISRAKNALIDRKGYYPYFNWHKVSVKYKSNVLTVFMHITKPILVRCVVLTQIN